MNIFARILGSIFLIILSSSLNATIKPSKTIDVKQHYYSFSMSPVDDDILLYDSNGIAKIWDMESGQSTSINKGALGLKYASWTSDGGYFLLSNNGVGIWMKNGDIGRVQGFTITGMNDHNFFLRLANVNHDASLLVIGSKDRVEVFEGWNAMKLFEKSTASEKIIMPRFSPDGKIVLVRLASGPVSLWNREINKEYLVHAHYFGDELGIAFSPDSQKLAMIMPDNSIQIFDSQSGRLTKTLMDSYLTTHSFTQLKFFPDNKKLLAISGPQAKIFDSHSGKLLLTFDKHGESIKAASISSDGNLINTLDTAGTSFVWAMIHANTVPENSPDLEFAAKEILELQIDQKLGSVGRFSRDSSKIIHQIGSLIEVYTLPNYF